MKQKGLSIKVFEAAPEIKERGAAVFLQSFGLAALDEIKPGLADQTVAAGRKVDWLHLTRPDGETITRVDMTVVARAVGYPMLGITRHALQGALMNNLDAGDVEFGCRLRELRPPERDSVGELSFDGRSEKVLARAIMGADGRRSVVRQMVSTPTEKQCDWALTWWALADMPTPVTSEGEFRMTYDKKKAIYYGEVLNMVRSTPPSKLIEVYVGDKPLRWWQWSRKPGVSLIGDAAHAMLPSLAMGVTSALQDVAAMAKVVEGPQTPMRDAFKKYEAARRFPTALLQLTSRIAMIFIENVLCR